jgi:CheY-like chemotaxis protein
METEAGTGHLVLVVDDDDDIRETLCELLRDEGHTVVGSEDGARALEYLQAHAPPCLIILDLMMPVMDGWELFRRLQADPKLSAVPVVVVTAAGEQRARSIPARQILPKPLHLDRVLEAVEQNC